MLLLAIDTATPAVTAGVVELHDEPHVLATTATVDARGHAERLTPQVLSVLEESGVVMRDLDAVVVGIGPGPFTGLRVGIVTAAAYGHALDIDVYPVCSLDAIAADARGPVLVATDARRREVYVAGYDVNGSRVDGPSVLAPADVDVKGFRRAAGAGAHMYADTLGLALAGDDYPTARGLVAAAATDLRSGTRPAPLAPLYLRRPDATVPATRKRVLGV